MSEEVEERVSDAETEEEGQSSPDGLEGMKHVTEAYIRATDALFEWSKSLEPLQVGRLPYHFECRSDLGLRREPSKRCSMWSRCSIPITRFIQATAG